MFGRKKAAPTGLDMSKNKGYLNDISPEQKEVLDQFKEWINVNEITHNPWHQDYFLLKFCRARKFELAKVIEMFTNYMQYRKTYDLDHIIQNFKFTKKAQLAPIYPKGYCGVCKIGRPIYIERSGQIKASEVENLFKADNPNYDMGDGHNEIWKEFYQSYEILQKQIFMSCSHVFQKQIQHTFSILDMTGFNVQLLGHKTRSLVQYAAKISQDNYPEQLGQLIICNAPYLFSTVWAIIKAWLDEKTKEKIQLKGGDYQKHLLKYIDADQLQVSLGGNCTAKLEDDWGPWNDYEIVDGTEAEDKVGVRKKSDPTGNVFTVQDMVALPNYMIGESAPQIIATEGFLNADQQKINLEQVVQKQEEEEKFEDAI